MGLFYAWQKLYLAVDVLCGQGSQDARLIKATTQDLLQVRPDDLPMELRGEFLQLMSDLTTIHVGSKEENVQATIETLGAPDREKAVRTILILFSAASRRLATL